MSEKEKQISLIMDKLEKLQQDFYELACIVREEENDEGISAADPEML